MSLKKKIKAFAFFLFIFFNVTLYTFPFVIYHLDFEFLLYVLLHVSLSVVAIGELSATSKFLFPSGLQCCISSPLWRTRRPNRKKAPAVMVTNYVWRPLLCLLELKGSLLGIMTSLVLVDP